MDSNKVEEKIINVVSVSNYGGYKLYPSTIKRILPSEDDKYVLIWFTEDEIPNLLIEAPEECSAQDFIDSMYVTIRKASMKIVK